MSNIIKLLKSRQKFPKPEANWNFGNASKIQEGATAVDVAGWTGENLKAGVATVNLSQPIAVAQPVFNVDHLEFDGDGYLEGLPPQVGNFTYIIKYKLDASAGSLAILVGTTGNGNFQFFIDGDNISYKDEVGGATSTFVSGQDLRDGQTRTLAIVREGLLVTCYLDNVVIGTAASTATPFIADRLGRWINADFDFVGNMYNVLIFPTALDAVEVSAITASLL